MFCPRCGQQQISEEIRFCSRCGFALGIVVQVLAHDGTLPQSAEADNQQTGCLTRSKGWKFGLTWFVVFTFLLAPFWAIMEADALPEISAALGVFGGLLIVILSFIFLKNPPKSRSADQLNAAQQAGENDALRGRINQNVLPSHQSVPASIYVPPSGSWKAPDTTDLAQPGSVTEGTTKLLEKDE